jgi:hypothetical protein
MKSPHHDAICDWLQLDPGHYEHMEIEYTGRGSAFANYRITFLDGSVSDWKFVFDEDGTVLDGFCYNDVI